MGFGKAIAIIAGVAVGAVGAYNYSTTGCPLGTGSCGTEEATATAATQMVSAEGEACPLGCSMSCDSEDSDVATLAVADTAEAASCCSAEAVASECSDADAASCCSMDKAAAVMAVSETTEEAGSCCSGGEAAVVEVAEKADSCCSTPCDENAECDADACSDECTKAVASNDG